MIGGLVLVRSDGGVETRHVVRAEMVIGHGRGCELRLHEEGVLRRHAVIEHFSSGLAIRGLSSRAEVLVNDEQVSQRTLRPGDRISIGSAQFTVEASDASAAWSPPERTPHSGPAPPAMPADPVPPQVLARVGKPESAPPRFSGPPASRRRSVATHRGATYICLAIVLVDAIALGIYLEGI